MEIFVNNIKVPASTTLSLRFYNPMFNDIGGYSFPVTFNAKLPVIRKAFGYPGILAAEGAVTADARIKTEFAEFRGLWKVTEASDELIEAYFSGSSGSFYSLAGDKLMTSIDFGGVKYPAGMLGTIEQVLMHMDSVMNATYPDYDYCAFCAYMPNAYGDESTDAQKWVNEVEHDNYGNPSFKNKGGNQGNDTIYLFVGAVLDYLFNEYGYRIAKNVFREDAELQRLVIFNTYNRKSYAAFDYKKLVPRIKITDFLKAITNRFNIGFFINEQSKEVDIMYFDDLTAKTPKEVACRFISRPRVDARRTTGMIFELNPPDEWSTHTTISTDDFLPYVPITVNKVRDIVPGPLTLYDVYYVKAESAYYRVVYENSAYAASRICSANFPVHEGEGGTEVDQYCGIPSMYTHVVEITWIVNEYDDPPIPTPHYTDVDYVMPRCDLEATEVVYPNKEFPLMFMFNRGIQESYIVPEVENPTTLKYPLGTVDIYDARGTVVTAAAKTLNWTGTGGLLEAWTGRIAWEMGKKKIVKAGLTPDELNELTDYSQIVRIGNDNFIVNSLDIEISRKTVRIVEAELFRV